MGNVTSQQDLGSAHPGTVPFSPGGLPQLHLPGTLAQHGGPASSHKIAPSDGFFLINAARSGDVEVLKLFLSKNPALVRATHDTAARESPGSGEGE
jgi:hypothetical protein